MQEITVTPLEALYRLIGAASMIDSAECKDEAIYNTLQGELAVAKEVAKALAMAPKQEAPAPAPVAQDCGACHGSGWVPRDPDIGTEQECFSCDGSGKSEDAAPAAANGAMPELPAPATLIVESDIGHRAYTADQMRAYGQACAAAGPDAALSAMIEDLLQYIADHDWGGIPEPTNKIDAIRAALSGAKGN